MKNLKTKDYLGKARLVAASDATNAFTGFAGSEIKNVSCLNMTPHMKETNRYRLLCVQSQKMTAHLKTCRLLRQIL